MRTPSEGSEIVLVAVQALEIPPLPTFSLLYAPHALVRITLLFFHLMVSQSAPSYPVFLPEGVCARTGGR